MEREGDGVEWNGDRMTSDLAVDESWTGFDYHSCHTIAQPTYTRERPSTWCYQVWPVLTCLRLSVPVFPKRAGSMYFTRSPRMVVSVWRQWVALSRVACSGRWGYMLPQYRGMGGTRYHSIEGWGAHATTVLRDGGHVDLQLCHVSH